MDKVYLAMIGFSNLAVPSNPFFHDDMRLVAYVFDSIIFGTFILHLNSGVLKERWELSDRTIL